MFFGAGNVVFPLYVGLMAGEHIALAMLGLLLTAVALPLISLFAIVHFRGQQRRYFQRVGHWGGRSLLLLCLFLLGPFLVVPRTITVAHAGIFETLFPISPVVFGIFYTILMGFLAFNAQTMLKLISKVFTPLMLLLMAGLFVVGIMMPSDPMPTQMTGNALTFGLKEGYFTLDAIAALIFGQFVYVQLRQQQQKLDHASYQRHIFSATLLAGLLLSGVYLAMAYSAWQHGVFAMTQPDQKQALLILLTQQILPAQWTGLAGVIIAIACLTTATALSKIFADYLHHFTRRRHLPFTETHCLIVTLIIAFVMSLVGFDILMDAFAPVIVVVYPVFILLALHAFARQWINTKYMPMLAVLCLGLGFLSLYVTG